MCKQLCFSEVGEGMELPSLKKQPDLRQLVMWAGASEDYNLIHFDRDYALSTGLSDVIAQGPLRIAFLGQLVTDWIGDAGRIEIFSCRLLDVVPVGTQLICKGKVVKKYSQENKNLVECELWIEEPAGRKNATGRAVVNLPLEPGSRLSE